MPTATLEDVRSLVQEMIDRFGPEAPRHIEALANQIEDPDELALFEQAVASFEPPAEPGALPKYHDAPAAFARDLIRWPKGKGLAPYQAEILDGLVGHGRVAVRGPHGLGKTALASLAIWWFALTRDALGEDWKIITTASVRHQLERYLWPEVHKWYRLLRWDVMERNPVHEGKELLILSMRLGTGEAFSASPGDASAIEGAHAEQLLYIYDEAKAIPNDVFEATEGAFANAGPDTDAAAFALAISTPGEPVGRFYDIHKRKPGTEDWHARHVRKEEAIAAGRMSAGWASTRRLDWGPASALYQNRVEGEFASSDEDGTIPLAWVEAANYRWVARFGDQERFEAPGPLEVVGVDCSGAGKDQTVFAHRYANVVGPLERPRKAIDEEGGDNTGLEEMATAGRIVAVLRGNPGAVAIVDAGGLGSGIIGAAREEVGKRRVESFIAGAATNRTDRPGEWSFTNVRSAAWWNMREMLDPQYGEEVALPPLDTLTGDLCAPHYKEASRGKIQVESKDTIKSRLGRSTDDGDAVVQAFWPGEGGAATVTSAANVRMEKVLPGRGRVGDLRVRPRAR